MSDESKVIVLIIGLTLMGITIRADIKSSSECEKKVCPAGMVRVLQQNNCLCATEAKK